MMILILKLFVNTSRRCHVHTPTSNSSDITFKNLIREVYLVSESVIQQMQDYQIKSDLFPSESLKSMTVKNYPQDVFRQNNFLLGVQNARKILNDLTESLKETRKYENQLMRCRSSHAHKHSVSELSDSERDQNEKKSSSGGLETFDYGASIESWSTMSIVCLQYQYEELSKRYKSLLEEYDERCAAANTKDDQLAHLQELARSTHAQLVDAHTTLLAVGEKYMALRQRKHALKQVYTRRVHRLKCAVNELIAGADRARQQLDARLSRAMRKERNGGHALLLSEIRKCNHLCLENLRLKAQIQELIPSHIPWDYDTY